MSNELATIESTQVVQLPRLDVTAIQTRVNDIERLIDSLMVRGVHYGEAFPGSGKDSLLQAGAELMFQAFHLVADPDPREERLEGGHLRVVCEGWCTTMSGERVGRITAECSTMEPKYRYRKQSRVCPSCGQDSIMKSKYPDKQTGVKGWYCNKKGGGCGDSFTPDHQAIVDQTPGKAEHPDPQELWHTVRMMAQKRWVVAMARRTFALSSRFVDQDGAEQAPFDAARAGAVLRAIPGDRQTKWNRCIAFCVGNFGKGPMELNQLEGSVFLRWLGQQVDEAADFKPEDFGMSPEDDAPKPAKSTDSGPAKAPIKASPDKGAEESEPWADLVGRVSTHKISHDVSEKFGPPGPEWELNRAKIEAMLKQEARHQ